MIILPLNVRFTPLYRCMTRVAYFCNEFCENILYAFFSIMVHLFGCLSNFHCDKGSDIYLTMPLEVYCFVYICICNKVFCVNSTNIPFVNPYFLNTTYPEKLGTLFAMFSFFLNSLYLFHKLLELSLLTIYTFISNTCAHL